MTPYYDRDGITVYNADWRDVLPTLDAVDHVIEREERWCEVGVQRLAQMPLPLEVAR